MASTIDSEVQNLFYTIEIEAVKVMIQISVSFVKRGN